jgi:hypothetical protein
MTPAFILLGWAKPVIAVGTDLVWGTASKAASVDYSLGEAVDS